MGETRFGTCTLCEASCGLRFQVEGDRVTSIRGDRDDPFSRGHVCPKAVALMDLHDDPDRLRMPVRRTAGGDFEEIGWHDAIPEAADRLHRVQEQHGPDALGVYVGNPAVHNTGALLYGPPLLRALRTRNRFSATSVDQLPHMLAAYAMFGHQLLIPIPDVDRTSFFLLVGANPLASNGSLMTAPGIRKRLEAIQARGGRIVVVDPRRTETARLADEHVFVRPGTDAVFLFALLGEVLQRHEGRPRVHHLAGRVAGLDRLPGLVARFPTDRAASVTGIPAETIRRVADDLTRAESAVAYGRLGTSTQEFGAVCQWLLTVINLVNGSLDRVGGAMFTTPAIDIVGGRGGVGCGSLGRWKSRVRGLPEFGGELPAAALAEEILAEGEGRIRGLLTVAGNPVLSTPNGSQLDRAIAGLDDYVAIDPYVNETTRHAHLILPPASNLVRGHYDLVFHALAVRNTAKYAPPILPAKGEKDDGRILGELRVALERRRGRGWSRRGLEARAMLSLGPERLLDMGLRAGPYGAGWRPGKRGLTLERLKAQPHGVDLGPLVPGLPDRLPEGREAIDAAPEILVSDVVRLEATFAQRLGDETDRSAGDAPLSLIGRRELRSNNSWMHNTERLLRGRDRCTLLMHPVDAARRGIGHGETVRVRSRVGEVAVPVEITDDVMEGVVSLPHGYGHGRPGARLRVASTRPGASLNDLTDELRIDQLSGNAAFSGVPVTVHGTAAAE